MITPEEKKFFEYWEKNRERESTIFYQLKAGLPVGLIVAFLILLNLFTGWYKRANMVANSQSTPLIIFIAVVLIALFYAIFSRRHKWEMNEHRYHILLKRKELENTGEAMQHTAEPDSQKSV